MASSEVEQRAVEVLRSRWPGLEIRWGEVGFSWLDGPRPETAAQVLGAAGIETVARLGWQMLWNGSRSCALRRIFRSRTVVVATCDAVLGGPLTAGKSLILDDAPDKALDAFLHEVDVPVGGLVAATPEVEFASVLVKDRIGLVERDITTQLCTIVLAAIDEIGRDRLRNAARMLSP
jgi:hypothetical protein